jgi:TctA family transporter
LLALGIPGSAPSAVLMAAMVIHGVQPGPMMMIQTPNFVYDVVAITTLAMCSIPLFGLFLVRCLEPFFTRPISATIATVVILSMLLQVPRVRLALLAPLRRRLRPN